MNLAQIIERGDRHHPEHAAIIFENCSWTYRQLGELANQAAMRLARFGIRPGDRVALLAANRPGFIFAYFGVLKIGAVVVTINTALRPEELNFILNDCDVALLITDEQTEGAGLSGLACLATESFEHSEPDSCLGYPALSVERDVPAVLLYTSGTTGFPKGAVLSHGALLDNIAACVAAFALTPLDRVLLCLPMFHNFGQNSALTPCLFAGATLLLHRKFMAHTVTRDIAENQATVLFGTPPLYGVLYETANPDDLKSIRLYISAAARLPESLANRWPERFGKTIQQAYGITEVALISFNPDPAGHADSSGVPLAGVALQVVDEYGKEVASGEVGEITVRVRNSEPRYWNRPDAAAAFRAGWFYSGDLGCVDSEGFLYLFDRIKDMVNVGGIKVYPSEVERVLLNHPGVAEAAVYSAPDPVLGEQVEASLVLHPQAAVSSEELIAFCRQFLADFKLPAVIQFADSLPKNSAGKVLKRLLRERSKATIQSDLALPPSPLSAKNPADAQGKEGVTLIADWITAWINRHPMLTALESIDLHRPFMEYGITSVIAVQLARDLCAWLQRPLTPLLIWNYPNVASMAPLAHTLAGQCRTTGPGVGNTIPVVARNGSLPLSLIQEEVWLRSQQPGLRGVYNLLLQVQIDGSLDADALRRSFVALAERHEILRTTFPTVDGRPILKILPVAKVEWEEVTIQDEPALHRRLAQEAERDFDLSRGPLLCPTLLRLDETRHLLLITLHHIVADAWSVNLIFGEVITRYRAFSGEPETVLPPLSIQYADFAHWQRQNCDSAVLAERGRYWRELLANPPAPLELPTDFPRPPASGESLYPASSLDITINLELTHKLRQVALKQGCTLYTLILAVYATLLARHAKCDDLMVATPVSHRPQPDLQGIIGHFTGRTWLRVNLAGNPPFSELLERVKQRLSAALVYQDITFRQWLRLTSDEWKPERPLVQRAMLNLLPSMDEKIICEKVVFTLLPMNQKKILTDVALVLKETDAGLAGVWHYRSDLFAVETGERMVADLIQLLMDTVAAHLATTGLSCPDFTDPPCSVD